MRSQKVIKSTIIFLLTAITFSVYGQDKKFQHALEDANTYFEEEYFEDALDIYLELDSLHPNNPEVNFKIGACYLHSPFETRALPYIEKAEKLGYNGPKFQYYFGKADHLNHEFPEAIKHYSLYLTELQDTSKTFQKDTAEIQKYLRQCELGKKLYHDSLSILISNLGPEVNTKYPEYVPVISADESVLIFTSRRPNTTGGKIDIQDEKFMEDVYVCYKKDDGHWTKPKSISANINTKKHDACIGLSPDGQKLFIYKANKRDHMSGDIYVSELKGDTWSDPVKLGENINTDGWEPSASISADGKTLYFTSDRPGGYGGTDIYYSVLEDNGKWGTPKNMGPVINTPDNEDAPFIHVDGKTLFFSSKGHLGIGGYDIFISVFDAEKNEWGKPMNAGYPINTADDDIYFVWAADGTKGYFASFREDTHGEKDLYMAKRPTEAAHLVVFKGLVLDSADQTPLTALLKITDNESQKLIGVYNSNSITGRFSVVLPHGKNYNVTVEAPGYIFQSTNFDIPIQTHYFEVYKDFLLQKIYVEDSVTTDTTQKIPTDTSDILLAQGGDDTTEIHTPTGTHINTGAKIVLNNIFFDYDKATLRPTSKTELNNLYNLLSKNPDLCVELSGHTDNRGSDKYNQILSEKRALAVVKYLNDRGIDHDRMVAVGYGEKQPRTDNSNDSLRQENRRTELKLIKKEDIAKYDRRTLALNKYDEKPQEAKKARLYRFKGDMEEKPQVGDILNAIVHFAFDDYKYISDYGKSRLQNVIDLCEKYPDLKLRLHAHTDPFGTEIYNQVLSENRAETVKKYLISKGIKEEKLQISTYGETAPIIDSDDIAENVKNRRVEIEVIE